MKKLKTECHVCGEITKSETEVGACPKCKTDLLAPAEEVLQKQAACVYNKSRLKGSYGSLHLTNKRLLWLQSKATSSMYGGGLVGLLIASRVNAKRRKNDDDNGFFIPLSEIDSVRGKKVGLFGKAMILTTKDGTERNLSPRKRDEWLYELERIKSDTYK